MAAETPSRRGSQREEKDGSARHAGVQGAGLTHQRVLCDPGPWLCVVARGCPAGGQHRARRPGTPAIFGLRGHVPAMLPGAGPLRAGPGLTAPQEVAGAHLLLQVFLDAALPCQRPPPGQQGPRAPPTGAAAGARAALGRGVAKTQPQLVLFTAAVQATVRAPGGPAAEATASVFQKEVFQVGGGPRAPVFPWEPGAPRSLVAQAGPGGPGAAAHAPSAWQLAVAPILLCYFGDTEQSLTAEGLRQSAFRAPALRALLRGGVWVSQAPSEQCATRREAGAQGRRENTELVLAATGAESVPWAWRWPHARGLCDDR